MWICTACRAWNDDADQLCSACGKEKTLTPNVTTMSNSARLNQNSNRHDNKFKVSGATGKSLGASICTVCAVITWIALGLCGLFLLSQDGIIGLAVLAGGAITGLVMMAAAEVFQNIADIAASLRNMTITQTEYRED